MRSSRKQGSGLDFFRSSKEKLLPILINRTTIFFFVMCLFTLFLYVAGTVQEFTDSTQLSLLRIYTVLGIFLTAAAASGIILDLGRFIKTKKGRYVLRAGGYALLVIFAAVTVLMVVAIVAISGGEGV